MHGVIVRVSIQDQDAARAVLHERVVPNVSQAPGFVAGYWLGTDNDGLSLAVFESEEAAQAMADRVSSMPLEHVTIEQVDVREVVAHA
jgi:hypothetical protein